VFVPNPRVACCDHDLFECNDVDTLIQNLRSLVVQPKISGWNENRRLIVYADELLEELRERARDAAARDDGWRGFFNRPTE